MTDTDILTIHISRLVAAAALALLLAVADPAQAWAQRRDAGLASAQPQPIDAGATSAEQNAGATAAEQTAGATAAEQTAGASAAEQTAGASAAEQTAGAAATEQTAGAAATEQTAGAAVAEQNARASASQADDHLPYKYTGNLCSHKFHRPRCPYSRVMADNKKTRFHFRYQAVAGGYVPCRYCLPPVWTTVRATIKCQDIDNNLPGQKAADKSDYSITSKAPVSTAIEPSDISSQ